VHSVSSEDEGLIQFTVSGARAVMVSDLELCGWPVPPRCQQTYVFPAWKQSCDAVVKWDGTKFIYRRL
jgi:hypothetical protein